MWLSLLAKAANADAAVASGIILHNSTKRVERFSC